MPYDVPAEHVDQAIQAVEWYNTYYVRYPHHMNKQEVGDDRKNTN